MSASNAITGIYRPFDPTVNFTTVEAADSARVIWSSKSMSMAFEAIEQGLPLKADPFYQGIPDIKRAGLLYRNTAEENAEFKKCKFDIIHFAEKYCQLVDRTGKYNNIKLRKYQKRLLAAYVLKDNTIVLGSRQIGKTTTTAIFILWLTTFHSNMQVALLGDKRATAVENLNKIKEIYYRLPFFLKQGAIGWNVGTVVFANKSKVITGPCNKAALVGLTINVLFIDEAAIPADRQARELIEFALPTLEALDNSKCILASTPNGDGIFKDLCIDASYGKNDFHFEKIPWYLVEGRDAKWRQKKINTLGIDAFNEQYNCKFLSSNNSTFSEAMITYLESNKSTYVPLLKKLSDDTTIVNLRPRLFIREHIDIADNIEPVEFMSIHKDIEIEDLKDMNILLELDIAEGVGGDYTIMNMFEVTFDKPVSSASNDKQDDEYFEDDMDFMADDDGESLESLANSAKFRQIGIFRSNICSIDMVTLFVRAFASTYLSDITTKIVIERNTYGGEFAEKSLNERYPDYMLEEEIFGRTTAEHRDYLGVKIGRNKNGLVKSYLNNVGTGRIEVNEPATIEEMQNFGKNARGVYCGAPGYHDDIVMTLVGLSGYADPANENFVQWIEDIIEDGGASSTDDDYDDDY